MTSRLHPEDLLDRDPEELSPNERALLDAHLAQCVACRLLVAAERDFAAELASMDVPGHASERTAAMLSKVGVVVGDTELHPEDLLEREENGEALSAEERAALDAHLGSCVACRLLRQAQLDFQAELGPDLDAPLPGTAEEAEEDPELVRLERELEKKVIGIRRVPVTGRRARGRVGIALVAAAAVLMIASVAVAARGTRVWAVLFPQTEEAPAPSEPTEPTTKAAPKPKRTSKKTSRPAPTQQQVEAKDDSDDSFESQPQPQSDDSTENVVAPAPVPVPAPTACATVAPNAPPVANNAAPRSSVPLIFPPHQKPIGPMLGPYANSVPAGTVTSSAPSAAGALFSNANDARRRGDHAAAAKLYQDLLAQHANAPEAVAARVALGRMLLDDGDAQGALPLFDQYLSDGGGSMREEAMFGRARAYERLGRADMEREAWEKLIASYPQSVHTAHAEARIKELSSR